jgi:hypothetical protein
MSELSLSATPVLPVWLVLVLSAGLIGVLVHGSFTLLRREVPRRWIVILAGLRIAVVVLFALVLIQPVISYTRQAQRRPELLVLLDTSESMAQAGGTEGVSRLDEVRQILDGGLAAELGKRFDLRWFAFDRGATPLEGKEWRTLRPVGASTHYAEALTQAHSHPRDLPPERVLLVSDGHDQGRPDIVETARRLGLAVDVLVPGSPPQNQSHRAVVVADVQGSSRVLLGSETHFQVTLRGDPVNADRTVKVRLSEGGTELDSADVVLKAGRSEQRVRLAHRPVELGPKRYEFRAGQGEPFPLNVRVVDGKHEVLVLEDSWRWEFKFLRRVLEEDPSFRFTAILSRGGGAFMQFAAPDRRSQLVGLPQDRGQLRLFDTVVLGNVDPRRWPRDLAGSLRRLVVEEGKSLVVLAGPNLVYWSAAPDLLTLLPVEITRQTANPVAGPVPIRVAREGARSPFFLQPGSGPLSSLPALDQVYPPLRKKPAATVLLEAAKLRTASNPLVIMAEHTAGRGRVLYVGTDTLWKWQTLATTADVQTTPYHAFWQQTLRALAPSRSGASPVNLWLQPHRSRYQAGQRAVVRAEVDARVPLSQVGIRGVVSLPSGKTLPLSFTLDSSASRAWVAEFETTSAGPYRVSASVVSGGRPAAEGSAVLDVEQARLELDDSPVDRANLARIAGSTGGKVIDPGDPQTWPDSAGKVALSERVTLDLWNRWVLLILLSIVAGADWLLRLLHGYV